MAAAGIVVHVDAQHAAEEAEIRALGRVEIVGLATFVADRNIEKPVLSEKQSAAGMPEVAIELIDQDQLGGRIGGEITILHPEAGQAKIGRRLRGVRWG